MRVICSAVVEEDLQRKNLCECVKILGGQPEISGNTVSVEYEGPARSVSKFAGLFEQFPFHGVTTLP